VQLAFAKETLSSFEPIVRLIESPMEIDPGVPRDHFDLVFSIYGIGWTTDLPATLALAARSLRTGGCLIVSGEHPAYGCLEWDGTRYAVTKPYLSEGATEHASWKGVPIVIQHLTLGTFIEDIVRSGLQIERLLETPLNLAATTDAHKDPARWYSLDRARVMPTTLIIKARKPRGI